MTRRLLTPALILLAVLAFAASSASASSRTLSLSPSNEATLVPGNYCISCHLPDDARLAAVTGWKGGIGREVNSPCPAATRIHEELYNTERLMLMIDRSSEAAGALPEKTQSRLDGYTQRYSRLLDLPVTSLDAFVAESQTARYQLNKVYTAVNNSAEAAKLRTILLYAAAITLVVLGSMLWGLYNTRMVRAGSRKPKSLLKPAMFVLGVLAFFVMPIFRVPPAEVVETTTEQQEAQAVLDTADRSANAVDRAQARAWMLAYLGAAWSENDPAAAQELMEESLTSMKQIDQNNIALWGQSLSVQEAMVGVPIDMEKASLIATDLNAARARTWSLPLIAVELGRTEPGRAVALLQAEQRSLETQSGAYRDLQLRGVAMAWAEVKPSMAVSAAGAIEDAPIRSWTLRELSVFGPAAQAAREVTDPVQRARALRETALASGDRNLFDEALAALDGLEGAQLAYALSDLAAASGNSSLVERIDPAFPDARAAALSALGEYEAAWEATSLIPDPYERARAQAAIAAAWENADAALSIEAPLYRDMALRDVIRRTGNVTLMDSIRSPYHQVQSLTALGEYERAAQAANGLGDSLPLVGLVSAMAKEDPQAALALVEKMSRESDKAAALRMLAAVSNDPSVFEQALGMALAARVQGDALAPARSSLELAKAFWSINPAEAQAALRQAVEAALRIPTK
jgi:hypothetical protein